MNLVISVSGGETSGYMMSRLLSSNDYDSISCVFANTGQENEETLIFIDRMAKYFNINITINFSIEIVMFSRGMYTSLQAIKKNKIEISNAVLFIFDIFMLLN